MSSLIKWFSQSKNPLRLETAKLSFHYNDHVYQHCNGTICDINGKEGLFFIYQNDRIPKSSRFEIGVLFGDLSLVKAERKIIVTHKNQIELWELRIVQQFRLDDKQLDIFFPQKLENDQMLQFDNAKLASDWNFYLMNNQEKEKKVEKFIRNGELESRMLEDNISDTIITMQQNREQNLIVTQEEQAVELIRQENEVHHIDDRVEGLPDETAVTEEIQENRDIAEIIPVYEYDNTIIRSSIFQMIDRLT